MESMIEYVHHRCAKMHVDISIDFTMGNGFDTLFLSNISNHVYSFDIQNEALKQTKKLVGDSQKVTLLLEDHLNFDQYITTFDLGIFNLGYLPGGDHQITTTKDHTLQTLKKALLHVNVNGSIFLVVYIGHLQGKEEGIALDQFVSTLSSKEFNVSKYQMLNKNNAPYVIEIEKRRSCKNLVIDETL